MPKINIDRCKTGGIGSEVSASVMEEILDYLDAPVIRVAAPDTPAPFPPALSDEYVRNERRLVAGIRELLS